VPSVTASGSALSRRVSEVVGVGLFAAALIWLVSLASYDANDAAWFFSTGSNDAPANFAGRVGAFLAELSFQLVGYASYLIPAVTAVVGWRYFWCRPVTAAYTKITGALLLLACSSAFLAITLGRVDLGSRDFRAGGYVGEWVGGWMADFLSRTGSVIVLMAVMAGAVILATQFSFGHLFGVLFALLGNRLRQVGVSGANARSGSGPDSAAKCSPSTARRMYQSRSRSPAWSARPHRSRPPARPRATTRMTTSAWPARAHPPWCRRRRPRACPRRSRCRCPSPSARRPSVG
jgi:hypothetical protein